MRQERTDEKFIVQKIVNQWKGKGSKRRKTRLCREGKAREEDRGVKSTVEERLEGWGTEG